MKLISPKGICSILGVIGTYSISTNNPMMRVLGFTLYIITNVYWISHWKECKENIVVCQYIIYTILAFNGIYNTFFC